MFLDQGFLSQNLRFELLSLDVPGSGVFTSEFTVRAPCVQYCKEERSLKKSIYCIYREKFSRSSRTPSVLMYV